MRLFKVLSLRHFISRGNFQGPRHSILSVLRTGFLVFGFNFLMLSKAFAAPDVTLSVQALKTVQDERGSTVLKPAKQFDVGEIITYRINYANRGDEVATDVVIENPIPKDTLFVLGSASGQNALVELSADGGERYLVISDSINQNPGQLTHVRWTVKSINPGTSGSVQYQVKVK